jgi:hypothetical protein
MSAINRREMIGTILNGAAVAALGLALAPSAAESAVLTIDKLPAGPQENRVEDVQWGWHGHRRRRRVCWWRRGRRVCAWRWV